MTLVELVLAVVIAGFVAGAISMSLIVVLRSEQPTRERITEATDVAFLQTYLPVDYSSAVSRSTEPGEQPIAGETLPGTNVLTILRDVPTSGSGTNRVIVSYRYVQSGSDWQLVRYEYGNPAYGGRLVSSVLAHQLAVPPPDWNPGESPVHAIQVTSRTTRNGLEGDDMSVTFRSGNTFFTGGRELSVDTWLPTDFDTVAHDPVALRSRCGGRVTLVLDVSGSVKNDIQQVRNAATGFIDAFTGTPTDVNLIKFSTSASTVYPATAGTYFNVLTPSSAQIQAAKTAVGNLTALGWTNWDDALYRASRDSSGSPWALQPELIVFVTDGDPNYARSRFYPYYAPVSESTATQAAVDDANFARQHGARVIGILVGGASLNSSSVGRLKAVVGETKWDGTSATDVGNVATADYFLPAGGDFSQLGAVLKAVVAGECGGTVTIQKKIDAGGTLAAATQQWTYTTSVGERTLDPRVDSAITFDYAFAAGEPSKAVQIVETPNTGYELDRVECTGNGAPLGPDRVSPAPGGENGVVVTITANEAVSCTFIGVAR